MKILHTADLHVGACASYAGSLQRAHDLFWEILLIAKEEAVSAIVVAGDWFHRANPSHYEREAVAHFFADSTVPIFGIIGNHDKFGVQANDTAMSWAAALAGRFGSRLWVVPTAEQVAGVYWLAIPYGPWKQTDYYLIMSWLLDHVPTTWSGPVIAICHQFFIGATLDSGYAPTVKKLALPLSPRISYWALGDIHRRQPIHPCAWYPGSPYQVTFGEMRPKGVLIVDTDKPADPVFREVKKPKPLLELTAVPRVWPTNAYVKLTVAAKDIPEDLPPCVVSVHTMRKDEDDEIQAAKVARDEASYLAGMAEYLRDKEGLRDDQVHHCLTLAQDLIRNLEG